jgi:hypothetical protein
MHLDLSIDGKLDPETAGLFNQIALNNRQSFIDFVEKISKSNKNNLDWWVEGPASRNTYASPLFHYFCSLTLLRQLVDSNIPIICITVDSKALKKIIRAYLANQHLKTKVVLQRSFKSRLKGCVRPVALLVNKAIIHWILKISARLTRKNKIPVDQSIDVIIDTFLFPGYLEEDRTYTGLWGALTPLEQKAVYFVPNLYGFSLKELVFIFRRLRSFGERFLIKEDFLRFSDYVYAFGHAWRIFNLNFDDCSHNTLDFTPLIKEEIYSFKEFPSAIIALLNYRFAKRLKESGTSIQTVINRFENQVIDKAWNAGFNRYYPESTRIGYQGFIASEHYLCMYPTKFENECGILPSVTAVIGKGFLSSRNEFFPEMTAITAPALRFSNVWDQDLFSPDLSRHTILVALPISVKIAENMMATIGEIIEQLFVQIPHLQIWIKPHPTTDINLFKSRIDNINQDQITFVDGAFNKYLEKSNLLITNHSSTCLETLAKGIPVIIITNHQGLIHNPIPRGVDPDIWRLCFNSVDLAKSIVDFYHSSSEQKSKFQTIGREIREKYFEPATPAKIKEFIGYKQ